MLPLHGQSTAAVYETIRHRAENTYYKIQQAMFLLNSWGSKFAEFLSLT